ncbi:methylated-DNA--[protein]-cysteine S-methyltransferase [Salinisphaera aquimarina]|uniref:Methylated-DNA--protein-cysteine methyltransferase n=1 Tax=Salinisphaera aquimarina TaxID=2094031 RepID=A0ABV7ER16_9GAMM
MTIYFSTMDSPVGALLLTGDGRSLTMLSMSDQDDAPRPQADWQRDDEVLAEPRAQLSAYFAGERHSFDLPLDPAGTDFQRRVWRALRDIPCGATESYGALAQRIESPGASRAVGLANGRNPIAIIIPCHRVIGANGRLTGYAGGLERKRWLLTHEGYRGDMRQ